MLLSRELSSVIRQNFQIAKMPRIMSTSSNSLSNISKILHSSRVGQDFSVCGWIKSVRKQKHRVFLDLNDGLSAARYVLQSNRLMTELHASCV